jgi:hypothetical protein
LFLLENFLRRTIEANRLAAMEKRRQYRYVCYYSCSSDVSSDALCEVLTVSSFLTAVLSVHAYLSIDSLRQAAEMEAALRSHGL